jgi:hypothetical protein
VLSGDRKHRASRKFCRSWLPVKSCKLARSIAWINLLNGRPGSSSSGGRSASSSSRSTSSPGPGTRKGLAQCHRAGFKCPSLLQIAIAEKHKRRSPCRAAFVAVQCQGDESARALSTITRQRWPKSPKQDQSELSWDGSRSLPHGADPNTAVPSISTQVHVVLHGGCILRA